MVNFLDMQVTFESFWDDEGYKLRACMHCGLVKRAVLFNPYVFYERNPNLGCCRNCEITGNPKKSLAAFIS